MNAFNKGCSVAIGIVLISGALGFALGFIYGQHVERERLREALGGSPWVRGMLYKE